MRRLDATKWADFAGKVQGDVIVADAADQGSPISDHDVKRATLHTRHDMVLLATHLAFLNAQAEALDRKARWIVRLLWVIIVLLAVLAFRHAI